MVKLKEFLNFIFLGRIVLLSEGKSPNIRTEVRTILSLNDITEKEDHQLVDLILQERSSASKEADEVISNLKKERETLLEEISILSGIGMLERLEDKYKEEFNNVANLTKQDNNRKELCTYIFIVHRHQPHITHILKEIVKRSISENLFLDYINEVPSILDSLKDKFLKNIVETGKRLNKEKHKYMLLRHLQVPLMFRGNMTDVVFETVDILEGAFYILYENQLVEGKN